MQKCSICGEEFEGWGNNAWPINDGTCCDFCNMVEVLPARMAIAYGKKSEEDKDEQVDKCK